MWPHIGLLPQCLFIVRSRAKVNRLKESYVSRAAQRPLGVEIDLLRPARNGHEQSFTLKINPLANGRFARKADVAATSAVGGSILYVAIGDFPMVGPTHVNQPIGEFSLTPILKSPILHQ